MRGMRALLAGGVALGLSLGAVGCNDDPAEDALGPGTVTVEAIEEADRWARDHVRELIDG